MCFFYDQNLKNQNGYVERKQLLKIEIVQKYKKINNYAPKSNNKLVHGNFILVSYSFRIILFYFSKDFQVIRELFIFLFINYRA